VSEPIPLTYRIVMAVATPVVRWWSRMEVVGLDAIPERGPVVLLANHDSHWDPLVIATAALSRRQIRALAKASLWKPRPVGWVLDRMGQIPIERGRADRQALEAAVEQLRAGACIGVFPEGTISWGKELRALSGAGRLALAVPGTRVVCVATTGVVDIVRFPKRPRIRVEFFEPAEGQAQPGEMAARLTKRVMAEVRVRAPQVSAGRRRAQESRRLANM
jgi:1-acyl-sn-glycerol-3-phosphate acyltransferase